MNTKERRPRVYRNAVKLMITCGFLGFSTLAQAQISQESLSELKSACQKIKPIQRTWSSDGDIRAEYITYCEGKDGVSYIWFEAAAEVQKSFRGGNQAPWMHYKLIDSSGNTLLDKPNAWLVEVGHCGGYNFHFHRVPSQFAGRVYDVQVSIGGTGGDSCENWSPFKDVVNAAVTVAKGARDCNSLDAEEREICTLIKAAIASGG